MARTIPLITTRSELNGAIWFLHGPNGLCHCIPWVWTTTPDTGLVYQFSLARTPPPFLLRHHSHSQLAAHDKQHGHDPRKISYDSCIRMDVAPPSVLFVNTKAHASLKDVTSRLVSVVVSSLHIVQ